MVGQSLAGGAHIGSYVCVPECCRKATDEIADMQTYVCATRVASGIAACEG